MQDGVTLVTGASGFVGSAVVRALLARGSAVRVLTRPTSSRANLDGVDVEVATGRLEDRDSLDRAVAGVRTLYHVAADYRLWVRDPGEMMRANVEGTRQLMLAAMQAGVERIVYTSSVATLGIVPGAEADEATPVGLADMIGAYKRSKYLAEEAVRELVREARLPAVIVNPSTPIGPRDVKPTPTGRIIVECASGRMPGYVDTGLNFVHVDDVAEGHLLAMAHGTIGERYILGGENWSLAEFLGHIAAASGRRKPWLKMPRRAIYPLALIAEAIASATGREPFVTRDGLKLAAKHMFFSSAKAVAQLGYRPRPAHEGVADAVAWFRAHGYCPTT